MPLNQTFPRYREDLVHGVNPRSSVGLLRGTRCACSFLHCATQTNGASAFEVYRAETQQRRSKMPIRHELRPLYPSNWKELSRRVRFDRARGLCEACGRPHARLIRCLPDGRWFDPIQQTWRDCRGRRARWPDLLALIPARTTRIVLAAAHLDHDPTNSRLRNLKSLCQRCHILHDRPYHRAQRWITHRRRYAAGDLFLGFYRPSDREDVAVADPPEMPPRLASPIEVMRAFAARHPTGGGQPSGMAIAAAPTRE
jgi:hypothetical protein